MALAATHVRAPRKPHGRTHVIVDQIIKNLKAEAALSTTFEKGYKLQRSLAVSQLDFLNGSIGSCLHVTGKVEGSYGNHYSTSVDLDMGTGEVVDYSCTCQASVNFPGMCKHEIALGMSFLAAFLGETTAAAEPEPQPRYVRGSSTVITELLRDSDAQRLDRATSARRGRLGADAADERASFSVAFVRPARAASYTQLALKLTVHQAKAKYIVKNIGQVVDAWRSRAEFRYGPKISLRHVPSSFDERACRLLDLLADVVDTQQALYLSRWDYVDGGRGTEVKELPLGPNNICDILDLMQGETVELEDARGYYDDYGYYYRPASKKTSAYVVGEKPVVIGCRIVESPDDGYEIELPDYLRVICDGERAYVAGRGELLRQDAEFARTAAPLLQRLLDAGEGGRHVSAADAPSLCRSLLPALRACTELEVAASLAELQPVEPEFSFSVGLDDGLVTCRATVAYGDWKGTVGEKEDKRTQPARDMAAEYHVLDVVEDYFQLQDGAYCFEEADEELLFSLLTDGLRDLSELGEVLLSERLRAIDVRPAPNLSVQANLKSDLLNLEIGASGMSERELREYLAGFKRKQRFVRLSSGDIVQIGNNLQVADALAQGLGVEVDGLVDCAVGLSSRQALLVDALLRKADGVRFSRNGEFRTLVRDLENFSDADIDVPAGLDATLRSYQEDGFRWLATLERFGFGGILADDMGLGKTLQVIALILSQKEAAGAAGGAPGPTLVVCPASLVYNWVSEIARFAPGLDAVAVLGTKTRRTALIGGAATHDVLVTSYDLLRKDIEAYTHVRFDRVVLDEAQYIKNPKAQVTKAVKCLDARSRFALTGTPIENRLQELWSIFDFLMPGYLGARDGFAKRFESPVEAGEFDSSRLLRSAIGPFVLRRLKREVLADLPEKTENVVVAQMEAKQKKLYLATQDRLALQVQHVQEREFKRDKLKVLAELTKLRQLCCDPSLCFDDYDGGSAKLDTCMELLAQAIDAGHRVLLFSQFTSMLSIIAARLDKEGVGYFTLTGATSKEERERLVKRFQAGEKDVFLISLKAGGVGLNLTAADVVIHYDPWWNTAAQDQATDRAYRIGQRRDVSVFKLIVEGTIEERILKMQQTKRDLADTVLSGEEVKSALLSKEDLLGLLGV